MIKRIATVIGLLVALAAAVPAHAVWTPIAAVPGSTTTTYLTQVAVAQVGDEPTFANLDIFPHDVASRTLGDQTGAWCAAFQAGLCPLFYAPLVGLAQTSTMQGLGATAPGVYVFYCTIHPWMEGTLVVV